MSIIFSEDLARAVVYPVPNRTNAISYIYTPDRLVVAVHLKDKWATINHTESSNEFDLDAFYGAHCSVCDFEGGGRCESVVNDGLLGDTICPRGFSVPNNTEEYSFTSAQSIFQIDLNIANKKHIFTHIAGAKARMQGTKVEDGKIILTRLTLSPSNVHEDHSICWGRQMEPNNLKGIVNLFFSSRFNDDIVTVRNFRRNCTSIRRGVINGNFESSRYNYIAASADALLMIHSGVHLGAFFQMTAAGFKPIPECTSTIVIPLNAVEIEHEGETYRGYKTPYDACRKSWFVSPTGELVGQL
jgi:hypothetical protein